MNAVLTHGADAEQLGEAPTQTWLIVVGDVLPAQRRTPDPGR